MISDIQFLPHQQNALDETLNQNRVAYYLDMGLGKTFVGGEKMIQLGSKVNLLICQKSKIADWMQHFKDYYPTVFQFDLTDKSQMEVFKQDVIDIGVNHVTCIGIINYEMAFRRTELLNMTSFTLMLDESSLIQNEKAKRSKFILKLHPENVILLSGTPTGGKYEKLWSQLHLLGWNITKDLYFKHYVDYEWVEDESGFFRKNIIGYKNVERLKKKLRQYGAVFMKSEEVLDLPEQVFNKVMIPLSKEYKKFAKSRIINIDGKELIGDCTLTKQLYQRMLCGHYNLKKLEVFRDLIDSTDDRLIVFYNFNEELDALVKLCEDRPISIVNGSVNDQTAYEEFDNSITFVQYQAGAMGLNFQKANKVIYFTLPQWSELFEQSKKRIHRIGQQNRCLYYYLICKGSVEEDILSTLEMRKDYTDELFKIFEEKSEA